MSQVAEQIAIKNRRKHSWQSMKGRSLSSCRKICRFDCGLNEWAKPKITANMTFYGVAKSCWYREEWFKIAKYRVNIFSQNTAFAKRYGYFDRCIGQKSNILNLSDRKSSIRINFASQIKEFTAIFNWLLSTYQIL